MTYEEILNTNVDALSLIKYPDFLFEIDSLLSELKIDLGMIESDMENRRASAEVAVINNDSGAKRKYKSQASIKNAVTEGLANDDSYRVFVSYIREQTVKIEKLKNIHAMARRKMRILELENQATGVKIYGEIVH